VLIKKELASFFDGARWIDEVIPYSVARGLWGFFDRRRIVGEIRSRRFDLGVLFPNSFEAALWITMAGIRRRAGFVADARGALLTLKRCRRLTRSPVTGELLARDGACDRCCRRRRRR